MSMPTGSSDSGPTGATPYVLAADFEEGAAGTSPGLNHPITGTTIVPINEWHHAAATYGAGTWRLYLDGNLEATLAVNQPPRSDTVQGAGLGTMIPVSSFGPPVGRFQGVLDEARVWDHARTGADILASKNAELTSGSGLVARWGLDEGTSTLVGDSIATAANGTVTGSGYSWVVPPPSVPGAPTIGTATAGDASAIVSWSAPASNGGSAITGYVVTPYIGASAQTTTTVGNVTSTSVTGLTNGTAYTFRVAAINAVGAGGQSANSNPVTPVAGDAALDLGSAGAYVTFGDPASSISPSSRSRPGSSGPGPASRARPARRGITNFVPLLTHGAPRPRIRMSTPTRILGINTDGQRDRGRLRSHRRPAPTGSERSDQRHDDHHQQRVASRRRHLRMGPPGRLTSTAISRRATTTSLHPRSDSVQHAALGAMIQSRRPRPDRRSLPGCTRRSPGLGSSPARSRDSRFQELRAHLGNRTWSRDGV